MRQMATGMIWTNHRALNYVSHILLEVGAERKYLN